MQEVLPVKVLFLDIDGVLNSHEYLYVQRTEAFRCEDLAAQIDPAAVERLNDIIARTGCEVVLSSVWRLNRGLMKTWRALLVHGFKYRIIDSTPADCNGYRGKQILSWLTDHPEVAQYAVVDDSDDMDGVRDRLVQTTFRHGLQDEHVDRLVELLT